MLVFLKILIRLGVIWSPFIHLKNITFLKSSHTIDKYLNRLRLVNLVWQPVYEKENTEFKPACIYATESSKDKKDPLTNK